MGKGQSVSLETDVATNTTATIYHHTDHLTGAAVDTDQGGYLLQVQDYLPFGTNRVDERFQSYANKKKFTGKELDTESGLYYYGARYYDSDIGRWMGVDPLVLKLQNLAKERKEQKKKLELLLSDSQKLNNYTYVLNNPLKYIDELGLWAKLIFRVDNDGSGIADWGHVAININGTVYGFGPVNNGNWFNTVDAPGQLFVQSEDEFFDSFTDQEEEFVIIELDTDSSQDAKIENYFKDLSKNLNYGVLKNTICTTIVGDALQRAGILSVWDTAGLITSNGLGPLRPDGMLSFFLHAYINKDKRVTEIEVLEIDNTDQKQKKE